ncbi:MAG: MFS transporter [Actinomycetia bacterium]|nr:MFS transporter [Actinomycetes bacterium]
MDDLYPVLPRFVEDELGGTGASVGMAVGSFGVTAALLRPVAGRLGDRYGRRVLVVGGMIVVALSLLGYLVVDSLLAVVALRLLFGAGEAFAFVGLATAIQDMAAGPPLGEWLFDGSNYDRVWVVAAGLVTVGIVLGLATPSEPAPAPYGSRPCRWWASAWGCSSWPRFPAPEACTWVWLSSPPAWR